VFQQVCPDQSRLAASGKNEGKFTSKMAKPPQEAATKTKGVQE
jgi:hypothetical protein